MEDEDAAEVRGIPEHFDGPRFGAVNVWVYIVLVGCCGFLSLGMADSCHC